MAADEFETRLQQLAQGGLWEEFVHDCEAYELEMVSKNPGFAESNVWFYTAFLFSYLITDDVNNARFLYKRIKDDVKKDVEIEAAWAIAKCIWNQKLLEAHAMAIANHWQPQNKVFVDALQDSLQDRTLKLFSTAYSNIAISDLAQALGCDSAQAISMAQSKGLVKEVQADYIIWKDADAEQKTLASSDITGLGTLKKLAQHTLFIEK
jgi:COP9 signalosome complex subunit 8|mmetsp:Transcript_60823/g.100563  ORF Transcript_60823/g.100563 Transcript_60823/m.100563 type:complete len:208 (-) Transcript_60823:530-1153(-)|eukprot:CAMPEP_0174298708 /NCGR_PEP_ID=MMETSP0809-20121228/54634_1 /TAXON_ID=73025 ORGANISM="Eutreptiella gymnastica-like, Strain CCMP1594" /NCGR_SAMPLE_ID=MMETSP0809 /ASSEMBLY_ACC=CAM_ASM_000658 /LENGTH=207 /DNA_ID=CAMNT_0015403361 /DNA_START=89 /DNA_END=712 /DNA_ORIENTATION=-